MLLPRSVAVRVCAFVTVGVWLAGCAATPMAPTLQVTPGRGKSPEQFTVDDNYCRQYAGDQVKGLVNSANSVAVAAMLSRDQDDDSPAVLGANQQGNIQGEYDQAYGRCMFANHNIVPGYGPPRPRIVRHRAPTPDASKASASAPSAANWVAPKSGTSSGSGSDASGWVAPK
jgi:hypothetical protein